MKVKYKVLIIGAGKIGAFFDTPNSKDILTHAHAFSKHKGFDLLGFIDKDQKKAEKAAEIWGGKVFNNIEDAFKNKQIDVVCNATSTDGHYEVLREISKFPLKLVLTEKPLTENKERSGKIKKIFNEKNSIVVVAHSCYKFSVNFAIYFFFNFFKLFYVST